MNRSTIEWTHIFGKGSGFTWNPIFGCSFGCSYCYARRQAKRRKHLCQQCYDFTPHLHPERLGDPLKRKKPAGIFLGSMADLYGPEVPQEWRDQVWDVCVQTPQHQYFVLTKQPQEILDTAPVNVLRGFSCNNQETLEQRSGDFPVSGAPLMVSIEPLHGSIPQLDWREAGDWIIVGAETGQNAAAHKPEREWVDQIIKQARERGCIPFVKDNLRALYPDANWPQEWPEAGRSQ